MTKRRLESYLRLRFSIRVVPDEYTDGSRCYRAFHPELPGCMSHGDTPQQAIANLAEARQMVIEHLLETRQPIPRPAAQCRRKRTVAPELIWSDLRDYSGTSGTGGLRRVPPAASM